MQIVRSLQNLLTETDRAPFPWEEKAVAQILTSFQTGQPTFSKPGFRTFVNEGYKKNETVYACINEISSSFNEPTFQVVDGSGSPIPNHPFNALLTRPNPYMSSFEFIERYVLHLLISGNAYIEKVRSGSGRVVELWILRPDRMGIATNQDDFISGYIYRIEGKEIPIPASDIIHLKLPDPLDEFFGMAPLEPGSRATDTDNEVTDFTKVTLENRGVPGTVIQTQKKFDDKEAEKYERAWLKKFGKSGRGKPAFMPAGTEIKTVGQSMNDLLLPELSDITEARICEVFQVPPILINANVGLKRSTYSNYALAKESFWDETMIPHLTRFTQKLNAELLPDLDNRSDRKIVANTNNVQAFQERNSKRKAEATTAFTASVITRNEARAERGLPAVAGGDVFVMGLAQVSVEARFERSTKKEYKALDPKKKGALDGLRIALGRNAFADLFLEKLEKWARKELKEQASDILSAVDSVGKGIRPQDLEKIIDSFPRFRALWEARIGESSGPILFELITGAGEFAGADLGVQFDQASDQVLKFVDEYKIKFANRISQTTEDRVRDILHASQSEGQSIAELRKALQGEFKTWSDVRAQTIARSETIRSANMGAKLSYKEAGVLKLQWIDANDEDVCPYCVELDGTIVGIDDNFINQGDVFEPEGASSPLSTAYGPIEVPPAHSNCRCSITPVFDD